MSDARETAEQRSLRVCTTRALEARAAVKKAITVLRQLPEPLEISEREKHQVLAGALKEANARDFRDPLLQQHGGRECATADTSRSLI